MDPVKRHVAQQFCGLNPNHQMLRDLRSIKIRCHAREL